jgi:hypothetical protein
MGVDALVARAMVGNCYGPAKFSKHFQLSAVAAYTWQSDNED